MASSGPCEGTLYQHESLYFRMAPVGRRRRTETCYRHDLPDLYFRAFARQALLPTSLPKIAAIALGAASLPGRLFMFFHGDGRSHDISTLTTSRRIGATPRHLARVLHHPSLFRPSAAEPLRLSLLAIDLGPPRTVAAR